MLSISNKLQNGPCLVQYYMLVWGVDKKQANSLIKYVQIMISLIQEMKLGGAEIELDRRTNLK